MADTKRFKSVLIQSSGTRGDAQPLVAVALKLKEEGYDVTIITNKDCVDFVQGAGVRAVGVWFSFGIEMTRGKMRQAYEEGNLMLNVEALDDLQKEHAPEMVKLWYQAVSELKPDVCISATLCDLLGMVMLRHFNTPTITIGLQPIPLNPPKMILGLPNVPCCGLNKCIVKKVSSQMVQSEADTYGAELKKQFGIDWTTLFSKQEASDSRIAPPPERPILIGCDPRIAYCLYGGPEYVPNTVKLLGFLAIEEQGAEQAEKPAGAAEGGHIPKQKSNPFGDSEELVAIDAFIKADAPPLYIGFGSMVAGTPAKMVVMLCEAVKLAGARAIIYSGWAKLSQSLLESSTKDAALIEYAKSRIMFVGNTPHPWLFPQCSCVIHHGGAGTTCTAARAFVKQIIIPVIFDQWDMAHYLNVSGTGVGFSKKNLTKVTSQEVSDAIKKVVADQKMGAKVKEWGEAVTKDPGAAGFVQELHAWWDQQVVTGKVKKHSEAALKAIGR